MLIASNRGVGMNIGFPDVCNTPVGPATVPIPYPNLALNAMATPFSPNVRLSMVNALNMASTIPMTMGDEGGLAHPTFKGSGRYTMGNPIVYVNYLPGINLCCPTTGNNMNNPLGAVLVPSVTNVFFTYLRSPEREADARPLSPAAIDAIADLSRRAPERVDASLLDGAIGYIDVPPFSAAMPTRVARAIEKLEREGMRALLLDLRDNPGGELDAFLRLAEDFLCRGSLLGRQTDHDGDEILHHARNDGPYAFPLCLLINRHTASAAELFAGCMQWHGRAALFGERTYGKGSMRRVSATELGFVEAEVAQWSLPGGEPLAGAGVAPDEAVLGERTPELARDPAVVAAHGRLLGTIAEGRA